MTLRAALGKDSMILVLLYLDTAQRPGPIPRNRRSAVVDVVGILAQLVKPTTSAVSHASSKAWRPVIHSLPHSSSLLGDARSVPHPSLQIAAAVCSSQCSLFTLRCKVNGLIHRTCCYTKRIQNVRGRLNHHLNGLTPLAAPLARSLLCRTPAQYILNIIDRWPPFGIGLLLLLPQALPDRRSLLHSGII